MPPMKSAIVKTGDIKNNIRILQSLVQRAGFKDRIDYASIAKGIPTAFLPLLHFLLTDYSVELSKYLLDNGFEFFSKNDLRFIEETFKVLRKIFNYKPTISIDQFFTVGFSERKVILTCDLARICIDKNKELTRCQKKIVKSRQTIVLDRPQGTIVDKEVNEKGYRVPVLKQRSDSHLESQAKIRPAPLPLSKDGNVVSTQKESSSQIITAANAEHPLDNPLHQTYNNNSIALDDVVNISLQPKVIRQCVDDGEHSELVTHGQNRNSHFIERVLIEDPKANFTPVSEIEIVQNDDSDEILKVTAEEDKAITDSLKFDEITGENESSIISQLLADRFAYLCNEHIQQSTSDIRSELVALKAKYNDLEQTLSNRLFLLENRVSLVEELAKELHKESNNRLFLTTEENSSTDMYYGDSSYQQAPLDTTEYSKSSESLDGILGSLRQQIGETKELVQEKLGRVNTNA